MNRFGNVQLLLAGLAVLGLSCMTAGPAKAQFTTGFEPADGYTAGTNVDGTTDLNLGATWYRPNGSADDPQIVDTYGGTLGLPQNPAADINGNGNTQFIGGLNAGTGTFNRAQLNFPFASGTTWTISYDICVSHVAGMAVKDNISSFSFQPSDTNTRYFIQLNAWHRQSLADPNGRWKMLLEVFDATGNGPIVAIIPAKPARQLLQNHWYNIRMTIDLNANTITAFTATNLKNGKSATVNPTNAYLQGGAGGGGLAAPSAFRFFTGGGTGMNGGNIVGFDNLCIVPGPAPAAGNGTEVTLKYLPWKQVRYADQ